MQGSPFPLNFLTYVLYTSPSSANHVLISFGVKFNAAISSQVSYFEFSALRLWGFPLIAFLILWDAQLQVYL